MRDLPSTEKGRRRNSGRLLALQRIVQEVGAASDLDSALASIVRGIKESMATDVCSVYLRDDETGSLVLSATDGLNVGVSGNVRLSMQEGLVGLVAQRSKPVNVRDAPTHPSFKAIPQCDEDPFHGFLGVPIMRRGETLGIIVVQQAAKRIYRETDVAFLVTLAGQLAGVLALARVMGQASHIAPDPWNHEFSGDAIAGAPGVAVGVGVVAYSTAELDSVPDRDTDDPDLEESRFRRAVNAVAEEMRRLSETFEGTLSLEDRALFDALAMITSSDALVDGTIAKIRGGLWAPGALRQTIDEYVGQFDAMEDPYFRERAWDIRDIGRRLFAHLQALDTEQPDYPHRTILVGEDLSPVDLGRVPSDRLAGVISGHGSSLSHLSILARALGIPAVVGVADAVRVARLETKELIIDGYQGRFYVNPGDAVRQEYGRLIEEERVLSQELGHLKDLPAETSDGFRVSLYANAGILADLSHSLAAGAEGIGLYRTELPFMLHEQFPGEEEQVALYRQVLEAYSPKPVTLRTLDIGGDKTPSYFPIKETNPALGWRGVRVMLDNPVIFLTQLRAMIRASAGLGNLRILIPMVNSVDEAEEALGLVRRTWTDLQEEGVDAVLPPCGLMIEVPSAVYQASALARLADFLSVGTNDLTQYLLAVDRGNERVARRFESLHPAVTQALMQVVEAARLQSKPVSVCGQAAGDPAVVVLLLGMGIDNLSMSASDLPRVKSVIRTFSVRQARSFLNEALGMEKAGRVREFLESALDQAGLGGLVRAGR